MKYFWTVALIGIVLTTDAQTDMTQKQNGNRRKSERARRDSVNRTVRTWQPQDTGVLIPTTPPGDTSTKKTSRKH